MRRPFFLLEVLIAVMLIGMFAYMSIHGAFRVLKKQSQLLTELENSRRSDLAKMDLIEKYWNNIDALEEEIQDNGFKIKSKKATQGYYLLELSNTQEKFAYLVKKQDPSRKT